MGEIKRWLAGLNERARPKRFVCDRDRHPLMTTRALLRHLLGGSLRRDPGDVEFGYNRHGRPRLIGQGSPLEFNVSHSSDVAVFAFSRVGAVGVDVEATRDVADGDSLAERFFTPAEARTFRAVPPVLRGRGFFNCSTRKEAGVARPLPLHQRDEIARSRCLSL